MSAEIFDLRTAIGKDAYMRFCQRELAAMTDIQADLYACLMELHAVAMRLSSRLMEEHGLKVYTETNTEPLSDSNGLPKFLLSQAMAIYEIEQGKLRKFVPLGSKP